MHRIHAAHHTACRVLLEKKFPKVFWQVFWSLLFSIMPSRCGETCFERGLHSQFGMAYNAMLLPDAIPTIFPLSKKAVSVKAPTNKRGAFLKRERLRVSGHLVILPRITHSTSVQNEMFTPCSPFQCSWHDNIPWFSKLIKHRVWFYILARQT